MPQILDTDTNGTMDVILNHGFLPDLIPLKRLSDPYYQPWEEIASHLPCLIAERRIREVIDKLPVLSTGKLREETEWRRACVALAFMLNGYIWGGEVPSEVDISILPFVEYQLTSSRLYH